MQSAAVKKWKRKLQADLKTAERAYRWLSAEKAEDAFSNTLLQTYFRLETEGRAAVGAVRNAPSLPSGTDELPRAYGVLSALCADGQLPSFAALCTECRESGFTIAELTLTELLLKTVFLSFAAKAIREQAQAPLAAAVRALAELSDLPFHDLFSACSNTEALLCRDRGFACADAQTRAMYRSRLSRYAEKAGISEEAAVYSLLDTAAREHTSLYQLLLPSYKTRSTVLLICEILLPLAAALFLGKVCGHFALTLLFYFPLWATFRSISERIFCAGVPPFALPAAELRGKIPASAHTVITVSALLPKPEQLADTKSRLLDAYLRAGEGSISVCLLADLKGADSIVCPEDNAHISAAKAMIDELNTEFPNIFSLFIRERTWSPTGRVFTGADRKRGAINDFVQYLRKGETAPFAVRHGACTLLPTAKYLFCLDSDTRLTLDCLYTLVCVAEHPDNAPNTDETRGCVTRGYGIFAPRVENTLDSVYQTRFSHILSGAGGVSGYDMRVSERWQDLFGAGLFTGKGLVHIDAYAALLPDAFEKETVLSHDIPEGELLRTAFVSDVQVSDGVPSSARAYFARLGRWIRGDMQNAALLGRKLQTADGVRKNPFSFTAKYKLFDNLRRAATPVFSWALILTSVFFPSKTARIMLCIAVLSLVTEHLLALLWVLFRGGVSALQTRFYGKTAPDAVRHAADGAVAVMLLPVTAFASLRALILGFVRRFITHRNMLEWVTAADSERAGTVFGRILSALPSVLTAAWLLVFGSAFPRLLAISFLAEPLFSWISELPYPDKSREIRGIQREKLISCAASMWKYYAEQCNAQNHFLPPDNVQTAPIGRVAHRTSPTNIGLALCAALSACDLYLITPQAMCTYLLRMLSTIEKLAHWHGNLYNWYDTETLVPLAPQYVSAVDSGNFLCCLCALREGVSEYLPRCPALRNVIEKIDRELKNAELSALYDRRRDLFYIGYDLEKQAFTPAHYDLLMSESRMMSYYACAARQVPKSHWSALSRVLSKSDGYAGALSWSGTMFEYFMPYLFLESRENTLTHEALRYCAHCQRVFAHRRGVPFGVSESGYYRFDAQGNYQYRAHGIPRLALRRSVWDETVISPYSTFLVLPFLPKTALHNLEELEKMHATGEYGFFEALDFRDSKTPRIVRSFMAHHVGMSLLSVDNALLGGIMQKRFLKNARMRAGGSLLEERVPSNPIVFKRKMQDAVPDRPARERRTVPTAHEPKLAEPQIQIYSNGTWSTVLSDCGTSHSLYGGVHLTRESRDTKTHPLGVFAVLRANGEQLVGCRALKTDACIKFLCAFSENSAQFSAESKHYTLTQTVCIHAQLPAELRHITVTNKSDKNIHAVLTVYFEPSLTVPRDEAAHKTYQKLFVTADRSKTGGAVFTRRTATGDTPLLLGCGVSGKQPYTCVLSRTRALPRLSGVYALGESDFSKSDAEAVADTCFLAEIPLDLPKGGKKELTLYLCCARDRDTLETRMALLQMDTEPTLPAGAPRLFADTEFPMESVLPPLFGCAPLSKERLAALRQNHLPRTALWKFGISGDRPLWLVSESVTADFDALLPILRFYTELRTAGIACDLVLLLTGGTESTATIRATVESYLQKESRPQNESHFGSIFYLRTDALSESDKITLAANAEIQTPHTPSAPVLCEAPVPILSADTPQNGQNSGDKTGYTIRNKPHVPWVYALANPSFSTLAGDSTLGVSHAINSRLNKLTVFSNDTVFDNYGERLFLRTNGKVYDILKNAAVRFGEERAQYTAVIEDTEITVTVTVPERGMQKQIAVSLCTQSDVPRQAEICYLTVPALSENGRPSVYLQSQFFDGGIEIKNPCNGAIPGFSRVESDCGAEVLYTVSHADFAAGRWDSGGALPNGAPCAALTRRVQLLPHETQNLRFFLAFGHTENSVRALRTLDLPPRRCPTENRIVLASPDENLNTLFNAFLPNQIINGRIFARTGFYQSGGAYGFRDQLQDAACLLTADAEFLRRQIFRCCAAQFEAGDVLHWWHPTLDRNGTVNGVRTRYSDDLLWLPFALAKYVLSTGDKSILQVRIAYLSAEELGENEKERYFDVPRGKEKGSVEEHAVRAVNRALRFGTHGLLLMGAGDWNDSFTGVGAKGKGESVWLSQFAVMVLEAFGQMLQTVGKDGTFYFETAAHLRTAVETHAWEGDRYLRAYYDDGEKMGSADSDECQIDSLTQSFSVFAKLHPERCSAALQTAFRELVDTENGVVRLFAPAFSGKDKKAGYVAAYPAGIRENGGQYTHAAVWFCRALFQNGETDMGETVLHLLNPLEKYQSKTLSEKYLTEPYYLAGDVYAAKGAEGRGGWSLYSGSAGHFYALIAEELLGIQKQNGSYTFSPNPPKSWGNFRFSMYLSGAEIQVEVPQNRTGGMEIDKKPAERFTPDGKNHVIVLL